MGFFNITENDVLDNLLGAGATLLSGVQELALSKTTPNDDGTNITEPSGSGYARVSVVNDGASWAAAAAGLKDNAANIVFPVATGGDWGIVTHFVIYDLGVPVIWGLLDDGAGSASPKNITETDQFRFLIGELRVILD